MTLNYWIIVERFPKPNEVVGGSISGRKIFSWENYTTYDI
jgi:hypothetical protein